MAGWGLAIGEIIIFSSSVRARRVTDYSVRSEEHTSELQSLRHLVCRLLLEKTNRLLVSSFWYLNPGPGILAEETSAPARSQELSLRNDAARDSRESFPISAADLRPRPTKYS